MQEQQKVENVWVNRNSSAENYGLSTVTYVHERCLEDPLQKFCISF